MIRIAVRGAPVALAIVALSWLGCVERVMLSSDRDAAPAEDSGSGWDANVPLCHVLPTDDPGIGALLIDDRPEGADRDRTMLVRGTSYWIHAPALGWIDEGPIAAHWPDAPRVQGRLPWEGPGIDAIGRTVFDERVTIVSGSLYWSYVPGVSTLLAGEWVAHGTLEELFPDGIEGQPWGSARVVGIFHEVPCPECPRVIADQAIHTFTPGAAGGSGTWSAPVPLREAWIDLPSVELAQPWDPPGVTAYHRAATDTYVLSGARMWIVWPGPSVATGRASDQWRDAPTVLAPCR